MRIITELKEILYHKGLSLKFVAEELSKKLDKPYSLANLSNKLRNETITYKEMKLIAEIIDCKLELVNN
ncbi:LLM class flavin-dependent oxidoreductase [bacterium]|nr:LLM class flavin-dependent oxidoreductase [bacterium]